MIRWMQETTMAAEHLGWTVVDSDGTDDYQGWGTLLLRKTVCPDDLGQPTERWATLAWSYGSCSGCDRYEDMGVCGGPAERCAEVFGELIQELAPRTYEEQARDAFRNAKGW